LVFWLGSPSDFAARKAQENLFSRKMALKESRF